MGEVEKLRRHTELGERSDCKDRDDQKFLELAARQGVEQDRLGPALAGAKHVTVSSVLLTPLAVTKDNLNVIVDKGWITKAEVCAGVKPEMTPYCK